MRALFSLSWSRFVWCWRWVEGLIADLGCVLHDAPVQRLRVEWRACRHARRLIDERIAAWRALPPEDQVGYVHPASPTKPPGWTIEKYRTTQRRRDGAN